ncbi:hypothetical protein ETW23_00485 [Leisingera sp. NJS201]|uniref:phage tail protein n=1 Tax=Leisingera sp. NJS201 TaxID=2508306 RepID=UPI0010714864|nr:phage tail protein [Leisingera sp. NJS201]QBR34874.1 hypothetical protein ETW23_00485 [Leisingera sp. NJS201]
MAVFSSIAAAVSAVATWTVTVGGVSVAVGSFLLQAAVSFGTSAVAAALAGKDSGPDNFPIQGTLRAGGQVPRSFVIGPGGTAGSLTWHTEWGQEGSTPNFYYTQVIALADFPVSDLRRWFVDGQPVTLEDTGADPGLAAVEYRVDGWDHAWIRFYDGTQTEADPFLTDVVSARGSRRYSRSRIGVGVAYAVVTFAINNELFSGLPESFFELDGVRLYDVSKDSTAGGSGSHRWDDQSTWGGDGDALPAVQAYNLARGIYFERSILSGALDENGTVELDAGASKLSFEIVGGGGGGGAAASAGGATTVTLKDGSAVVQQWAAQGGAAGAAASGIVYQPSGEVSALSPRGDGGRGVRGYKEKDLPPVSGEAGGSAGEYLSVKDFDISGLSEPSLEVSVGAGGSGNGSAGRAGGISYQADVAPSSVEPQWLYGMQGVTGARLPAAHWIAQIAKCRNLIESGSGLEPAYRCAGEVRVNSELGATFEAVLTSCSGRMSEMGGVYKIYVGAPDAPVAHIEDGDISSLAPQSFTPFLGLAETVNGITASYPSPDEVFALRSTPPLYSAEYEAEDGGRRLLANVQLSLVPFPAQAQRLVKGELEAARRARRHSFTLLPRFRLLEPGDTLTFTSVRNGFVDKLFRVDGIIDLPNADLIVDITEVDPADHGNWEPSTDYTDVTPAPIVPVAPVPQTVKGFDPAQGGVQDGSGAARGTGLLMQWDPAVEDVAGIRFQVRLAATEVVVARVQTRDFSDGSLPVTEGIVRGEAYEARAKYIPGSHRPVIWTGWIPVTASDVGVSASDLSDDARQDLADDAAAVAASLDADFEVQHIAPLRRDLELQAVEQRTVAEALGVINGHVLWAVRHLSDVDSRLSDAGIVKDPETGNIRIYGLEAEAQRVSEVEVRVSAAEAILSLSATQAYVNQQISVALTDPGQFPLFEGLQLQVNQVAIDLNAAEAALALKASQTVVDGIGARLSVAEVAVDAVKAKIELKADQSDFSDLQGRVQTAEVQISAFDGPSISQAVADGRYLLDGQDAASVGTLKQLLQAHDNREAAKTDLGYAMQDMRAKVDDDRAAMAKITTALGLRLEVRTP